MRACTICGKGSVIRGKRVLLRGHYNPTKTERKYPNLQWVRLPAEAGSLSGQRVKACTNCMKNIALNSKLKNSRVAVSAR